MDKVDKSQKDLPKGPDSFMDTGPNMAGDYNWDDVDPEVLRYYIAPFFKGGAIDDGGISSREMDSGDISVQHKRPELEPLWPGDAKEQNQGVSRQREDPTAIDPVVTDQRGSDSGEWFQKTRYPETHHKMQITTAPEDEQIGNTVTGSKNCNLCGIHLVEKGAENQEYCETCKAWVEVTSAESKVEAAKSDHLLLTPPVRQPGSDPVPGRKSVPTGEGGVIGIPGIDGSSPHVVNPADEEKPVDEFRGGEPTSNTVDRSKTRPIGLYQHASAEIFAPINGEDLLLDL